MKYIAYCRKSTDEKEKQVLSIEQQICELKQFAQRENLEIVEFLTEAQTAKVPGRKVFAELIRKIEEELVNGIVSWNPDRLARNSIDGGKIIYLLDIGKLKDLKFPTHWFDNTPQGKFMLNIAFGQSKYYVDNLSENVKRGLHFKARRGEWPSYAPFGYVNDRNTRTTKIVPEKTKLVQTIFSKFAGREFGSMREVRDFLFKHEVKRKNGMPLHYNQIREMLTRTFYYGVFTYSGETYEGKHEPIISKKLFDKVQEVLRKKYNSKPQKHEFDFTGFIKCKNCDSFITAESHKKYYKTTNREATYVYYRCVKKKGICSQPYVTKDDVESQLREIVASVALSEVWVNKMLELLREDEIKEKGEVKIELARATISLGAVEKKLDKLLEFYLEEIVDTEGYQSKKNQLLEQKMILKEKIAEIKTKGSSWLEPMKEFIKEAASAAKIAREKNNCHDLTVVAKKVGSNFLLQNKRIEFCPIAPHDALAARPFAARANPSDLLMCSTYIQIRTYFKGAAVATIKPPHYL